MFKNRVIQTAVAAGLILVGVIATISAVLPSANTSADLTAYFQSERASAPAIASAAADLTVYHNSERSQEVMPVSGFADIQAYHLSERTSTPVRNLGTLSAYQLSEWFDR